MKLVLKLAHLLADDFKLTAPAAFRPPLSINKSIASDTFAPH
jgi:hypothetical protein